MKKKKLVRLRRVQEGGIVQEKEPTAYTPIFQTEEDRKRYQERLKQVANKALGWGDDEDYLAFAPYHPEPNGYDCINGICGLDERAGLKFSNAPHVGRYFSNPTFANNIQQGLEDYYQVSGNFQPGDHLQVISDAGHPIHSMKVYDVEHDKKGKPTLYRVIQNGGGTAFSERTYTPAEMREEFHPAPTEYNPNPKPYMIAWRPGKHLDREKIARGRMGKAPFPFNQGELGVQQYYTDTFLPARYSLKEENASGLTPESPLYYLSGSDVKDETKSELLRLMNDPVFAKEVRGKLRVTDQDLKNINTVIFGLAGVESNFNYVNAGRGAKEMVAEAATEDPSVGPLQIRLGSVGDRAKSAFNINTADDLKDIKKAYIAAVDRMMEAKRVTDAMIAKGHHPELANADPYFRAAYYYNQPQRVLKSDEDWARENFVYQPITIPNPVGRDWKFSTAVNASEEERAAAFNEFLNQSRLRGDKGSYMHQVMQAAAPLQMEVLDDEEGNAEALPAVEVVGKISRAQKDLAKKRLGGISTEGYKRTSPDRFNAFNIIPSNLITMQDVPHPVLGIDNTGARQIMLPGTNYQFPGQAVVEFPLPIKNNGGNINMKHFVKYPRNFYLQTGGAVTYNPPQGYTPSTVQERANWNKFLDYLQSKGVAGSADLDAREKSVGLNYLNQYNKLYPAAQVPETFIPKAQYESYLIRKQSTFPSLTAEEGQKVFAGLSPAYRARPISAVDSWLGSNTSKQYYPAFTRGKRINKVSGATVDESFDFGVNFEDYIKSMDNPELEDKYLVHYANTPAAPPPSPPATTTPPAPVPVQKQVGGPYYVPGLADFMKQKTVFAKDNQNPTGLVPTPTMFDTDPELAPLHLIANHPQWKAFLQKKSILSKDNQNPSGVNDPFAPPPAPPPQTIRSIDPFWGVTSVAGLSFLGNALEANERNRYRDQQRLRGLSDSSFSSIGQGSRGDYTVNEGYFRPDQYIPVQFGAIPRMQAGGGYFDAPAEIVPDVVLDESPVFISNEMPAIEDEVADAGFDETGTPNKKVPAADLTIKPNSDARMAFDYYVNQRGLAPHIAAGIIGNLYRESGLKPTAEEKANTAEGRGIAQWNVNNRWVDFQNWAKKRKRNYKDLFTQLDYVLEEPGWATQAMQALAKTRTPEEASYVFGKVYERPAEKHAAWGIRAGVARHLFNEIQPHKQEQAYEMEDYAWSDVKKDDAIFFREGGRYTKGDQLGHGLLVRQVENTREKNNTEKVRSSISPVDRDKANIEAEKGETVWGDFDGDAIEEHYKIGGKRHTQGGTPLMVPHGSFIFSDTKKLKLGGPILQEFGKNGKGKHKYTFAQLAKKYDLNKYKALLARDGADKLDRDTGLLMLDNYQGKLSKLAFLQEAMKGFPQGIPQIANNVPNAVNNMPTTTLHPSFAKEPAAMQQMDNTNESLEPAPGQLAQAQLGMWVQMIPAVINATTRPLYDREYTPGVKADVVYPANITNKKNARVPLVQSKRTSGMYGISDWDMNDFYKRHPWVKREKPNFNPANIADVEWFQKIYNQGYHDIWGVDYFDGQGHRKIDGKFGQGTFSAPAVVPVAPTPAPAPKTQPAPPFQDPGIHPNTFIPVDRGKDINMPWWLQDKINLGASFGNRYNIQKYMPTYVTSGMYNPTPTFYDPTRALVAGQEAANEQGLLSAYYAGPQRFRSVGTNIQGQAAGNAANTIGQVSNQNVGVANQFALLKGDIINKKMLNDAIARKTYLDELATVNQQYDNSKALANNNMLAHLTNAITNSQETYWLNRMNEQFQIDPSTGRLSFTKGRGLGSMMRGVPNDVSGSASGAGSLAYFKKYYDDYLREVDTDDKTGARAYAERMLGLDRDKGMDMLRSYMRT